MIAVALGLLLTGACYTVFAPRPQLAVAQAQEPGAVLGGQLYADSCISCHGENLQGVPGRGTSLIGVGEAAVYFQVSTGRMPLARQISDGETPPVQPRFDPATALGQHNLQALEAFIEDHGDGPRLPPVTGTALIGPDVSSGGQLYRLNCASCHNFTGRGGPLTDGRFAPALAPASPTQIYAAMLSGPMAMPVFSDKQLSPEEKKNIIAYILAVRGDNNAPGGFNLGEWGPSTEGLVAFVLGMIVLIGLAAWIGARS
jgi:ubiquinol-cytochrome c reductase cytochrome c subunit